MKWLTNDEIDEWVAKNLHAERMRCAHCDVLKQIVKQAKANTTPKEIHA